MFFRICLYLFLLLLLSDGIFTCTIWNWLYFFRLIMHWKRLSIWNIFLFYFWFIWKNIPYINYSTSDANVMNDIWKCKCKWLGYSVLWVGLSCLKIYQVIYLVNDMLNWRKSLTLVVMQACWNDVRTMGCRSLHLKIKLFLKH